MKICKNLRSTRLEPVHCFIGRINIDGFYTVMSSEGREHILTPVRQTGAVERAEKSGKSGW